MDQTTLQSDAAVPHKDVEALLARASGRRGRRTLRGWLLPILLIVAFIVVMMAFSAMGLLDSGWPAAAVLTLTSCLIIGFWMMAERREMKTIEALAACNDLHAIGGLLDAVNSCKGRVKTAVETSLANLLPHVTHAHSALFGMEQREALNALLYSNSGDLAMAALSALEQVGDGTALPYLTSIAAGKGIPSTLRHRQAEVQARAQYTVNSIRTRIEGHNRASVLLRASQVPGAASDQLVRPAFQEPYMDGRELLRPQLGEETDAIQQETPQKEDKP